MNDLEKLRKLYLDDLSAEINYSGTNQSRVQHPGKWATLQTQIRLNESITEPLNILADPTRRIWLWSDTHFFHKNIISFSDRPYLTVDEMNEQLVANFNDYVGPNDISIWVGDVGFSGTGFINELLDQCNGYKILVIGNHDFDGKKLRKLKFDETHLLYTINTPEVSLVLTHYPMWHIGKPWFNVHGHLHAYPNPYTNNPLHYNICCELHNYRPIELTDVIKIAKTRLIATEIN